MQTPVFHLDPVVVVATRMPEPVAKTSASVTVIDAGELAGHAGQPVEDILAAHGVTATRYGGVGQNVSLFMRGTESDHVLVIIDGVPFKPGTLGTPALQNIRGADIERIEIVRGPASTLYGSTAIGGVISITTKHATRNETDLHDARVAISGGSNGTHEIHLAMAETSGTASVSVGLNHFVTDGTQVVEKSPVTGAHDNDSGTFNFSDRHGDTAYGVDSWLAFGKTRYVDTFALVPLNQDFHNHVISAWTSTAFTPATTLKTRIGFSADNIGQKEPNYLGDLDHADTDRQQADIELHYVASMVAGMHEALAGITSSRESVDALSYGFVIRTEDRDNAIYLGDNITLGKFRLGAAVRDTVYDTFGEHMTGQASAGFSLTESTYTWISRARGFRAPSATDRYGYGGNPLLQPERSTSDEAGVRAQFGQHHFSVAGFRQEIVALSVCDPIIPTPAFPLPDCLMKNLDSARITGTELNWEWIAGGTQLNAALTLQDAIDVKTGAPLVRRPEKQLTMNAKTRVGALEYRASLQAMSARPNSATQMLPGFGSVDVGITWFASRTLELDTRVENLADKRYALASGSAGDYLMPGRGVYLGLNWHP